MEIRGRRRTASPPGVRVVLPEQEHPSQQASTLESLQLFAPGQKQRENRLVPVLPQDLRRILPRIPLSQAWCLGKNGAGVGGREEDEEERILAEGRTMSAGSSGGGRAQGAQCQATCAKPTDRINPQFGFQACHTQDAAESISCLKLYREKKA